MSFDILYIRDLHCSSGGPTPSNHLHNRLHPCPKHFLYLDAIPGN